MKKLTSSEIAVAVGGRIVSGTGRRTAAKAVIDSREAAEGTVFFAIKGPNHDAHRFIPDAVGSGCEIVVISDETKAPADCDAVLVDDTLKALQDLAAWYIKGLDIRKVAVTGSVGKTSTRDLLAAGLSSAYRTAKSEKNYNNQYGVPLTVLSFDGTEEAAVIEMGMEHRGEIHRLADIVRPDIAVITNIGISHMENLGNRQGIMEAKLEITYFFTGDNALVINGDDDMLSGLSEKAYRIVRAGSGPENLFRVTGVRDKGARGVDVSLEAEGKSLDVSLKIPGAHNAGNLALALAACSLAGADTEEAAKAMENAVLTGNRLKISEAGGVTIIDDSYNAAPASVVSAVKTLMATEGKRHVAVLGGMAELGPKSRELHTETGEKIGELGVEFLVTIGENAADIARGAEKAGVSNAASFNSKEDMYDEIRNLFHEGDVILIKASRTMELEKLAEKIRKAMK